VLPGVDPEAADPARVEVPAIGVDAPIIALGLDPAGALEVPEDFAETGWWTGGPEPGEQGPAIIAGHIDSPRGPAVFYRLLELQPGDVVRVTRADGSRVEFTVRRTEQHAKAAFPTEIVYAPTTGSELRLITCGGAFDRSSGHYVDNVIVFATRS
jgi:sortase (surface protein transpeptidase)